MKTYNKQQFLDLGKYLIKKYKKIKEKKRKRNIQPKMQIRKMKVLKICKILQKNNLFKLKFNHLIKLFFKKNILNLVQICKKRHTLQKCN